MKTAVKAKVAPCARLFATPGTIQPIVFSRQEYWSGAPLPSLIFMLKLWKLVAATFSAPALGGTGAGWASVVAQLVKNPPAVQETWV